MATFEDALACANLLHQRFDLRSLKVIILVLQGVALHYPERFRQFHHDISKRAGGLPALIQAYASQMNASDRHDAAVLLSAAAITAGDEDLAMAYWFPSLMTARIQKNSDLVGISASASTSYDNSESYRSAASELVSFALSASDFDTLPRLDVLDLCCGTGLHADFLVRRTDRLVGVDLDVSGLVHAGRDKSCYTALAQGDVIVETSRLDGEFDLILLGCAAYFFKDLSWLFEQSARLLKSHGALVFGGFPCPDSHDFLITSGGNFRYCHSERYLREAAEPYGLSLKKKSLGLIYGNLPHWFLRFERSV